jgi:glycosyltransferase involved in cell wall biosynthesis
MSAAPLVSVITPVYNGEGYLRECIESVLAQTYTNWDYTIVNNGSTDRTLEIAREYAARDPRIKVHDNETFVRVIENHNIAFRLISPQSKYCKVVAADDWLFPECLEKMVGLARTNPRIAVVGAYGLAGKSVIWVGLPYEKRVISGRELCRSALLGARYVFGTPTAVLFRADIVRSRHAFYNESNLHADAEAYFEFLQNSDFGFVHQVLTFSREDEGSLTSYSQRLNTYMSGHLYVLKVYGPKYLSGEEIERMRSVRLHEYYDYLGWQAFKKRGREFWKFHRGKLAELGFPLSGLRVAGAAAGYVLEIALNPKRTIERALRRFRGGSTSSAD